MKKFFSPLNLLITAAAVAVIALLMMPFVTGYRDRVRQNQPAALLDIRLRTLAGAPASAELQTSIQSAINEIDQILRKKPLKLTREQEQIITRAADLATLGEELLKNNAANQPLLLTACAPSQRIFRDQPLPETFPVYRMSAAGREAESFQVIALPAVPLKNVQVSAAALTSDNGKIMPEEVVRINPVGYVEVPCSYFYASSRTGFWPDILTENHTMDLADRLQPYWITVQVPSGQAPGIYRGRIIFSADDLPQAVYEYEIEVHDFSLPVKNELRTFFDFRYAPEDPEIRRMCYDTLFLHRLQPVSMYENGNAPQSQEQYTFVPHLDDLEYCISKGQNLINLWYLNNPGKNPCDLDDTIRKRFADFIAYAKPLFQAKNAWDMCIVTGFDEIMHHSDLVNNLKRAEDFCRWAKKTLGEDLQIANVGKLMDIDPQLMDHYYMLNIPRSNFEHIQRAGKHAAFYYVYDDPSPMLDLPGMAMRILPWRVFREGGEGIGYYSTFRHWVLNCPFETAPTGVDWPREKINIATYSHKPEEARPGRVSDGNLFYPARNGSILVSTRIANLRDGIEDFEYLAILRKLDPGHPLLTIPDEITTVMTCGYTRDQKIIDDYRRRVADAIVRLKK